MSHPPYLLPWIRVMLLIHSITSTDWDQQTWRLVQPLLRRALEMRQASGRVLVIDDEPHIRDLLRDFLTTVGDEGATAATGAEALEAVPIFQPDVILTDMVMPGMSGTDVLDALRRAGVTVPVILISGQPITMPEGFFGLLRKPFDLRKLAEVVTAAMDHGRTERA
jgi:two-component system, OmpR family, response regulator MprA